MIFLKVYYKPKLTRKGTKKKAYVQEKFIFIAIGYIFFAVASGELHI